MQRNSLLAGFLAAALAFATTGATGATRALAADAAQEKTVNMAIFWLDGDIDPISAWHGWTLTRTGVGENLVQVDENLQFKPSIAEKWERLCMELKVEAKNLEMRDNWQEKIEEEKAKLIRHYANLVLHLRVTIEAIIFINFYNSVSVG